MYARLRKCMRVCVVKTLKTCVFILFVAAFTGINERNCLANPFEISPKYYRSEMKETEIAREQQSQSEIEKESGFIKERERK